MQCAADTNYVVCTTVYCRKARIHLKTEIGGKPDYITREKPDYITRGKYLSTIKMQSEKIQ